MEEEKSTTLKDEMAKLNRNFEEMVATKEVKKFKIPFSSRVSKGKAKEGYASICYINENRSIKFLKAPIKEGTIMIDGTPHLATTDYMLTYKNKPFLIVPSWNTEPFAPEKDLEKANKEKRTTYGYRLLLNVLKSEQMSDKKKLSGTLIFIILIAIIIGIYYLTKGGP